MRASRLVSLFLLLQTRGQLTAAELAEQLDVSERTIQRDVEALADAGVPVEAVRGPAGGYKLSGRLPDEAHRPDRRGGGGACSSARPPSSASAASSPTRG